MTRPLGEPLDRFADLATVIDRMPATARQDLADTLTAAALADDGQDGGHTRALLAALAEVLLLTNRRDLATLTRLDHQLQTPDAETETALAADRPPPPRPEGGPFTQDPGLGQTLHTAEQVATIETARRIVGGVDEAAV